MRRSILLPALVLASLLLPLTLAADNTTNINVNYPTASGGAGGGASNPPQQSTTFVGLNSTAIIVLVVLAVLVIALIVALAGRNEYP